MNLFGVAKLSRCFSKILQEKYDLLDNRLDENIKKDYNRKIERYNLEKDEKSKLIIGCGKEKKETYQGKDLKLDREYNVDTYGQ